MTLSPFSLADILDYIAEVLWKKILVFIPISIFLLGPYCIVIIYIVKLISEYIKSKVTTEAIFTGIILLIPLLLVFFIFFSITKGVFIKIHNHMLSDKEINSIVALREVLKSFKALCGMSLILTVFNAFLMLGPLIFITNLYIKGKNITEFILSIIVFVFILTGMIGIFSIKSFIWTTSIIIEQSGAIKALKRSWELTDHQFAKIAVIWMIVNGLIIATGAFISAYNLLSGIILSVILLPLSSIAETMVFYDLLIRKEAYDLLIWIERIVAAQNAPDNSNAKVSGEI